MNRNHALMAVVLVLGLACGAPRPQAPAATAEPSSSPTPIFLPTTLRLSAPSTDIVWALVAGTLLFESTDRGDTWQQRPLAESTSAGLTFADDRANASPGAPIRVTATRWLVYGQPWQESTDAGRSWHPFASDYVTAAPVAPTVVFADARVGYATVRGDLQRTEDGGVHWTRLHTPGTATEP